MKARISGTGRCVPEKVLSNADLEELVETSNDWIVGRTGIERRRVAGNDEATSSFAIPAVERAMASAGVAGSDIDVVICATVTPDMLFPSTACLIQDAIGAKRAAAFDLSAGCTGFIYGLGIASSMIESGAARNVAVVGAESLSKIVDWTDRSTCVLFGDGAGAVVLQASDGERGVISTKLHSDGSLADFIYMPGGGSRRPSSPEVFEQRLQFIKMRGNETFKIAVRSLAGVSNEVLEACGIGHEAVDWFIPHQANRRIIDAVGQRLGIREGRTVVNIQNYGNTSAATIPIALDELYRGEVIAGASIEPGQLVLMSAFGAGLTWGAALVRW